MKQTLLILSFILLATISVIAQTPESFKYQAVVRDASGNVISDQTIGLQIEILQGSETGSSVYTETHSPVTNNFGLINLNIGEGNVQSGTFSTIDWSADSYFVKVSIDITGGTSYTETGTSQLLSVPYALHAKTAETSINDADTDPNNELQTISISGNDISLSDGGGTVTIPSSGSLWTQNASDIFYTSGNVGIGTTTPVAGLDVTGGITISGMYPSDAWTSSLIGLGPRAGYFGSQGSHASHWSWNGYRQASTDDWVVGGASTYTNSSYIAQGSTGIEFFTQDYGSIGTYTSWPARRMTITPDGNIGIGTISPISKLHVVGNTRVEGNNIILENVGTENKSLIIKDNTSGKTWQWSHRTNNDFHLDYHNGTSWQPTYMAITPVGNVGIGTAAPNAKLEINTTGFSGDTLFCVKNNAGQPVFIVYPDAVQVIVDTTATKSARKGRFLVSGRGQAKGSELNFMNMNKQNYLIGHNSGTGITTGTKNSIIGYEAGHGVTTGAINTMLGYQAGYSTTTANANVFIGEGAGYSTTNNGGQIFIGRHAGLTNSTGDNNIFIGTVAGLENNSGSENVIIGYESCYYGEGSYNTFLGNKAGRSLFQSAPGNYNVFLGYQSGMRNKGGDNNTFIGKNSGYYNQTGSYNVFVGNDAGLNELGSNKLYIDNSSSSSPLIYGDFNTDYVTVNGYFRAFTDVAGYAGVFRNDGDSTSRYGVSIQCGTDNNSGTNYMIRFADGDNTGVGYITSSGGVVSYGTKSLNPSKSGSSKFEKNANEIVNEIDVVSFNPSEKTINTVVGLNGKQIMDLIPASTFYNEETDEYYTDKSSLVPYLIKALQEKDKEIQKLKSQNSDFETRLKTIEKYINNQKNNKLKR